MPIFNSLQSKWTDKHILKAKAIGEKHNDAMSWLTTNLPGREHLASGALSGLLLLTAHATPKVNASLLLTPSTSESSQQSNTPFIVNDLSKVLPDTVRELTPDEEASISAILSRDYHINVSASLEGKRLNRSYGYIGQEQHLARYPGDSMTTHLATTEEINTFSKYGMAPGLGAWRYFADSKDSMTQEQSDMEKYYIAVQTFLAPGWENDSKSYSEFFKFRKMLVVNPQNGKGIVVVIGDAGPASWTGKQLGGSPEVMKYLERVDGAQKGPVLYFFIDDPENKIKLGPINNI